MESTTSNNITKRIMIMTSNFIQKYWLMAIVALLFVINILNLYNTQANGHALSLVDAGQVLEAKGNIQGALKKYEEAVKLNSRSAILFGLLGNAYHKMGENDKALAAYQSALKRSPKHYWVHYLIGELYRDEHQYNNAIKYFNELISLNDNLYKSNKILHYTRYQNLAFGELGYCYAKLGRKQEAIKAYQQYLFRNPSAQDRKSIENLIKLLQK
jgi:tetratricopeptide (TPR) repeat protein